MNSSETVSRSQFTALSFCCVLSPAIRTLPQLTVRSAGEHAWISALLSAPALLLLALGLQRFLRTLRPGEGSAVLFRRALGETAGRLMLAVLGLWLLYYAAFILRSAAHRFISTIFPESSPLAYIPVMGALALVTGLGRFKVLGRMGVLVRDLMAMVLILVPLLCLSDLRLDTYSMPVAADILPILHGAAPMLSGMGILFYLSFLEGYAPRSPGVARALAPGLLLTAGMFSVLLFTAVGCFGPKLILRISNPFFVLMRNIHLLNTLERVEVVVIALWFFTDFVLLAALLHTASALLAEALRLRIRRDGRMDLREGRWLVWLCAAAATVCACFIAPTTAALTELSLRVIPILHAVMGLGVFFAVFLIGLLRKKL